MRNEDVREGDFFILSKAKGYRGNQLKQAMQVMELWDNHMTVKCDKGCMHKTYECFDKVTDLSKMDKVHLSPYFEDNRSHKI